VLEANQSAGGFLANPKRALAGSETNLSPAPGTVIGRYKLLQKIGEGGCGVVYMAEQQEPVRRRVALKVIKLGMDTRSVIARFEAERQALALMDHPNIARVLDAAQPRRGVRILSWSWCEESRSLITATKTIYPLLTGSICLRKFARPSNTLTRRHHPSRHQTIEHPGHLP